MILPDHGKLLVNTDLHGNHDDFLQLQEIFEQLLQQEPDSHWVILGDIVHAPNERARNWQPELYDYDDGSWLIARDILALQERYPQQIHFLLGNHDYAHVGGPRTHKFFGDEAQHLEDQLEPEQIDDLHRLFSRAQLAAVAPCGALMTHGAPSKLFHSFAQLDDLELPTPPEASQQRRLINSFMMFYGQDDAICAEVLDNLSQDTGLHLTFQIHGHDRDEDGFFIDGEYMICPVIFGAARENKRYMLLDLARHYPDVHSLQHGREILHLYP